MATNACAKTQLRRPHWTIVNEAIPIFFIGRNKSGFWVARESEGRTGGIFLDKNTAVRFARAVSAPGGCGLILVPENLDLDLSSKMD